MAQLFTMPQLGSTMEEGLIVRWHKQEGDAVKQGDILLEIETDKATMEVECPSDGVVLKILAQVDTSVPILQPIAVLGAAGDDIKDLLVEIGHACQPPDTVATGAAGAPGVMVTEAPAMSEAGVVGSQLPVSPRARRLAEAQHVVIDALAGHGTGPEGRIIERDVVAFLAASGQNASADSAVGLPDRPMARVTPLAARIADDLGIDLQDLALGLPGSRVRSEDVLRQAHSARSESTPIPQPVEPQPAPAGGSIAPAFRTGDTGFDVTAFTGMRKRIADNVAKSAFTAPHVTLTIEVDMTACASMRQQLLVDFENSFGVRLSYTDILVKAASRVLDEHPRVNSVLVGDEIRTYRTKNIGVAVALDEGLVVPVVKRAESKSLGTIATELKPLIERARTGKFTPEDLSGGTFSITNLGAFGIDVFDPILVPGQAAILGVGRIAEKPAVVDGQLAIRTMMNLCLSFDHRILDGAPAARFLQRLKDLLETPLLILI